jgi:hypothetical protein
MSGTPLSRIAAAARTTLLRVFVRHEDQPPVVGSGLGVWQRAGNALSGSTP